MVAFAFLKDLKANESRLKDINKVAEDLESEGLMAEEVQAVQQQVSIFILEPGVVAIRELCPSVPQKWYFRVQNGGLNGGAVLCVP